MIRSCCYGLVFTQLFLDQQEDITSNFLMYYRKLTEPTLWGILIKVAKIPASSHRKQTEEALGYCIVVVKQFYSAYTDLMLINSKSILPLNNFWLKIQLKIEIAFEKTSIFGGGTIVLSTVLL